ncbi:MAG: hypothetical protein DCC43_10630 [Candidatus Brocadia sp.]|jgi:hypothetical protein|uniref:Uncharacterized protein n=1 Tax=Candidatus Brocadia fulgida TaxID=380242 RepID=A0A0M2UWC2_9BACT|nr:MAG: hypothetical protein BROFUL_02022 [Candidatus Brocadia fulgida]MCC6325216.1 hypothetical protein [Candidatus Brocadia sp.]MCE7910686.1 hypothetical protein [Candidatus Brocadia sp. AMX3]MBV6518851.1 hypothetical protein [Candidatus Brocadia fulgida]MDG5996024.1 hypothetical protein [Candidatus Brocadia sp.]
MRKGNSGELPFSFYEDSLIVMKALVFTGEVPAKNTKPTGYFQTVKQSPEKQRAKMLAQALNDSRLNLLIGADKIAVNRGEY